MASKYNADHLSTTRKYQVQMTSWYEISIAGLSQDLTLLTQSCSLPEVSNPAVDIGYGNSTAKLPGKREYGEGSIAFMDAMGVDVEKMIVDWQNKVYNQNTGKMGWVDQFKKTVTITQYGPDGTNQRKWKLYGAWPSNVSYGEMSGENSDKKVITVTLTYDKAVRE